MSATTTTGEQIQAGTYNLDRVHSTFGFAITHNGVSRFRGVFEQVDAALEGGVLTGTAQVESVKTALPQLKEHLLSPGLLQRCRDPHDHVPLDRHPDRKRRQRGGRR